MCHNPGRRPGPLSSQPAPPHTHTHTRLLAQRPLRPLPRPGSIPGRPGPLHRRSFCLCFGGEPFVRVSASPPAGPRLRAAAALAGPGRGGASAGHSVPNRESGGLGRWDAKVQAGQVHPLPGAQRPGRDVAESRWGQQPQLFPPPVPTRLPTQACRPPRGPRLRPHLLHTILGAPAGAGPARSGCRALLLVRGLWARGRREPGQSGCSQAPGSSRSSTPPRPGRRA